MFTTIRDQLITEGRAEGIAQALERLLDTRGLALNEQLRQRIAECKDETLLQRWFDRAITATVLTEVFAD